MATTTRYHIVPEDNHASEDEDAADNERLLAVVDQDPIPTKECLRLSGHPTVYTRLAVICLLLPSFILLVRDRFAEVNAITACAMIAIIRNVHALLFSSIFRSLRVHMEVGGCSFTLPLKINHLLYFHWLSVRMVVDTLLCIALFVSTTVVGSSLIRCGRNQYGWACRRPDLSLAILLAWLASCLYLFSLIDGGSPCSMKALAGFRFDEEKAPRAGRPAVEARNGPMIAPGSNNVGAESSPLIV